MNGFGFSFFIPSYKMTRIRKTKQNKGGKRENITQLLGPKKR